VLVENTQHHVNIGLERQYRTSIGHYGDCVCTTSAESWVAAEHQGDVSAGSNQTNFTTVCHLHQCKILGKGKGKCIMVYSTALVCLIFQSVKCQSCILRSCEFSASKLSITKFLLNFDLINVVDSRKICRQHFLRLKFKRHLVIESLEALKSQDRKMQDWNLTDWKICDIQVGDGWRARKSDNRWFIQKTCYTMWSEF